MRATFFFLLSLHMLPLLVGPEVVNIAKILLDESVWVQSIGLIRGVLVELSDGLRKLFRPGMVLVIESHVVLFGFQVRICRSIWYAQ